MANFSIAYLIELKDRYTAVAKRVAQANQKIKQSFSTLQQSLKTFNNKLDNVKKSFGKLSDIGGRAFVGVSLPIAGVIGATIKLGAQLEDTRMVFTTMLGSAEKANKMVADVQKMASKTPFETQDLLDSTKLMLNFGIASEDVMKNLEMLGNISGGNKQRFSQLSLAFSQIASQGRLTGQDLLQMVNAGFNPLQIISKKTGKSMAELKDLMSKGGISFAMVSKAMQIATSEGGQFYNLMEKQSTTLNGLMSTLADNFAIAGATIGEKLLPYIKPLVTSLIKLTEKFVNLNPKVMAVVVAIGAVIAILPALMMLIGFVGQGIIAFVQVVNLMGIGILKVAGLFTKLNLATKIATAVQWLFNTSLYGCPIVWIIAGIVALIAIIVLLVKNWDSITEAVKNFGISAMEHLKNFWEIVKTVFSAVKTFIKENFVNILLIALGPIGLIIKGVMKVRDLIKGIGGEGVKVEEQIKSEDVSSKNTVDVNGEIKVSAEGGAKVNKTSSKTQSKAKGRVGFNLAKT